ncbi:MAG: class I SAM-dependent methyltransferase [Actinobacteria bacterium]|nr:class I SAM-dependent methyltransferase [Actinomycetota bacterium]
MKNTRHELKLTGERTLPGHKEENYWFTRHVAAYRYAASLSENLSVADIGCGEGYGTAMVAAMAKEVTGVDAAPEVMEHAVIKYERDNLCYRVMDAAALDFPSRRFNMVVSLQVIEHLATADGFLEEIKRVLLPGGTAIISTPNRLKISPGSDTPLNPFHLREFTPEELRGLLLDHFKTVKIAGLFHAGWLRVNDFLKFVDFIKYYEMGKLNLRYWTHQFLTPLVHERNFRIGEKNVDRCQDIIAICEKS